MQEVRTPQNGADPAVTNRMSKAAARNPTSRAAWVFCLLLALPLVCTGQIKVGSITSSSNFAVGLLKPGSLASIFLTGLQDMPDLVTAQEYPLPRTLAGVTVTFSELPAPAFAVDAPILAVANLAGGAYQQINVQIPWEVMETSGLHFDVCQQAVCGHFEAYSDTPWPVFFTDSSGYAIAQHAADYRLLTASDPAMPGEWVIVYATNLGPVLNQPLDGYPAALDALSPTVPDPSPYFDYYGLAIGPDAGYASTRIQSNYIGMAPGSVIYQVNVLIPNSQPAGDLTLQLVKIYDCGFFFVPGCGRSFTTQAASMPSKIPVAR
jgi:uncharacterized protein (TIGR03437 family)